MLTFATLTFLALLPAADPAVQADQEPETGRSDLGAAGK